MLMKFDWYFSFSILVLNFEYSEMIFLLIIYVYVMI